MITPSNPLGTPGFFEQPVFPAGPSILPGVLPQDITKISALGVSPAGQQDYMKNLMAEFMASMAEVQLSFAMYLGKPPAAK